MQTLIYIWRNLKRNKLRSILTILSVGFSLALMTVLHGYMAMQGEWGKEAEKHARIVVVNSQGFSGTLPIAYVDRVRSIPGIDAATPYAWYGGNYKEEQMPFAQFGTDPGSAFNVWDEFRIAADQLEAWRKTRSGCVVDRRLAEKRKWKIGDRIPLQGTYYPFNLDLTLCGVFDSPKYTDSLWFHWQYLDEGLKQMNARGSGNAGTIFAKMARPDSISTVARAIDDRFASSDNPTRTQSEACSMTFLGGLLGVAIGCLCLQMMHLFSSQFFPIAIYEMLGAWLLWLLAVAAGIGLVSGIVPAVRAAQLSVIDGLRRVV